VKALKPKFVVARWSPKFAEMRALSLRQPWAWLVVNGYKEIENRSRRTNHRGALLIHASSTTTTLQADLRRVKNEYAVVEISRQLGLGPEKSGANSISKMQRHGRIL